jgi:hypothetical protein
LAQALRDVFWSPKMGWYMKNRFTTRAPMKALTLNQKNAVYTTRWGTPGFNKCHWSFVATLNAGENREKHPPANTTIARPNTELIPFDCTTPPGNQINKFL